jgi:hypothetical protein
MRTVLKNLAGALVAPLQLVALFAFMAMQQEALAQYYPGDVPPGQVLGNNGSAPAPAAPIPARTQLIGNQNYYVNGASTPTNATTAGGNNTLHFASGSGSTNATTAAGNNVLHFASVPATVQFGVTITDSTTSVIPSGTTVIAVGPTTVTLSANVTGLGVGNGDTIAWSLAAFPVGATITDSTASVIPNNTTISSVTPTTVVLSANVTGGGVGNGDTIQWTAACGAAGASTCSIGSDSNNCQGPATACLTLQHALNLILYGVDVNGFSANIFLAHNSGTTNYAAICEGGPFIGTSAIAIEGDSTAPAAVVIKPPNGGNGIAAKDGCTVEVIAAAFADSAGNNAATFINVGDGNAGHVDLQAISLGGCAICSALTSTYSGTISFVDSTSQITGNEFIALYAPNGGIIDFGGNTLAGSAGLTFSVFAEYTSPGSIIATSSTFTGFSGVSGTRCSIYGDITSPGVNPNAIFPGSVDCFPKNQVGVIEVPSGTGGSSTYTPGTSGQPLLSGGGNPNTWGPVVNTTAHSVSINEGPSSPQNALGPCGTGQVFIGQGASTDPGCGTVPGAALTNAPGGFLDRFRNGTFDVWQRGTSALATGSSTGNYTADGWSVEQTGAQGTCSQDTGTAGTTYSLKCVGAASNTDTLIKQPIESFIAAALANNSITIQFRYKQDTGSTVAPKLSTCTANTQDSFSTCNADIASVSLTACPSGNWCLEAYSYAAASANAGLGYGVIFDCNTALSAAQHCWVTAADIRVTPAVSTGIQSAPPVPELPEIGTSIFLAQRYFETNFPFGTAPADNVSSSRWAGFGTSTTGIGANAITFTVPKRAVPQITFYRSTVGGTNGEWDYYPSTSYQDASATTSAAVGTRQFTANMTVTGATQGQMYSVQGLWAASAEIAF